MHAPGWPQRCRRAAPPGPRCCSAPNPPSSGAGFISSTKFKLGRKMSGNFPLKLAWGGSADERPNPTVEPGPNPRAKSRTKMPQGHPTAATSSHGAVRGSVLTPGSGIHPSGLKGFLFAAQTRCSAFEAVGAGRAGGGGLPGGFAVETATGNPQPGRGEQPAPNRGWRRQSRGWDCGEKRGRPAGRAAAERSPLPRQRLPATRYTH